MAKYRRSIDDGDDTDYADYTNPKQTRKTKSRTSGIIRPANATKKQKGEAKVAKKAVKEAKATKKVAKKDMATKEMTEKPNDPISIVIDDIITNVYGFT